MIAFRFCRVCYKSPTLVKRTIIKIDRYIVIAGWNKGKGKGEDDAHKPWVPLEYRTTYV